MSNILFPQRTSKKPLPTLEQCCQFTMNKLLQHRCIMSTGLVWHNPASSNNLQPLLFQQTMDCTSHLVQLYSALPSFPTSVLYFVHFNLPLYSIPPSLSYLCILFRQVNPTSALYFVHFILPLYSIPSSLSYLCILLRQVYPTPVFYSVKFILPLYSTSSSFFYPCILFRKIYSSSVFYTVKLILPLYSTPSSLFYLCILLRLVYSTTVFYSVKFVYLFILPR